MPIVDYPNHIHETENRQAIETEYVSERKAAWVKNIGNFATWPEVDKEVDRPFTLGVVNSEQNVVVEIIRARIKTIHGNPLG